jgi:flagellar protein FlbT
MHISLKPGEKIYVNGAVLRPDRRVSIEFLNDVTFLLESHVMQPEQATTPLRQLYFAVQTMLIDPASLGEAMRLYQPLQRALADAAGDGAVRAGLAAADRMVEARRPFEALKIIRTLIPLADGDAAAAVKAQGSRRTA